MGIVEVALMKNGQTMVEKEHLIELEHKMESTIFTHFKSKIWRLGDGNQINP
jgi:hypothetical protein